MMNKSRAALAAALLAFAAVSWAANGAAAAKKKAKTKPAAEKEESALGEAKGVDKKRFEMWLKERLNKIGVHHQARMDFFAKEQEIWTSFWNKVRDDRKLFEIRITRQTLDLFESLASLEASAHGATISNFEKLQGDVIKAFEAQQKAKMNDFFASRAARWSDFAADQEKERTDFVVDAEQGWRDHKASLRDEPAPKAVAKSKSEPNPAKAARVEEDEAPEEEEEAPKPAKKAPKPERKARASDAEDKWH